MKSASLYLLALAAGASALRPHHPRQIVKRSSAAPVSSGTVAPASSSVPLSTGAPATTSAPLSTGVTTKHSSAAQQTGPPQSSPPVPQSEIVTARYTLPPAPSVCTDAFVPFETTFWAQQNQMNMEDTIQNGNWWAPPNNTEWTFSTNTTGVFFSPPAWIESGNNPTLNFTHPKPNEFTMMMDGTTGGQTLLFLVFNDNGTTPDPKVWNATDMRHLGDISNYEQVYYQLTIKGQMPCSHPIGNNTCDSNKIDLNGDTWNAFGVDDFFSAWYDKRQPDFAKEGGMMQLFGKDFKAGNDHTCTIDNDCSIVQSCKDLPDGGKDDNSGQIFLVWQALQNISDMFNRIYNNMNVAQEDTMTKIAQIALTYYKATEPTPAPASPLSALAGIFGAISAFAGLIPGVGAGAGAALGAASGITGAIMSQKPTVPPKPDPQFAKSDADLGVVFGNYTHQMRTMLQDSYTSLFTSGEGMKELLSGGKFVDRTALNVDCSDCIPKAQQWLEQFLTLKMINYMWLRQSVFVTYMPYGKVIQLDSLEQTDFDIDACYSNFKSGKNSNEDKVLTACMPAGMARLTFYNKANSSTSSPDDDGSVNLLGMAPGADADNRFNSTQAVSVNFDPSWAAISAVSGFYSHGPGYDAVPDLEGQISKADGIRDVGGELKDLWSLNATSAGMFSLPVCQIRDLNYWPSFYGQGGRRSYNDYCICYNEMNDNSPYGPAFVDVAIDPLKQFSMNWREGQCDKGKGTEMAIGGSPVGLAPRASGHADYQPLAWP